MATIKKGDKYNRLTAIKFSHKNKHGSQCWLFRCDCGNEKVIQVCDVKRGKTKSCGCIRREKSRYCKMIRDNFKHGMRNAKIYKIWMGMKTRCLNKNAPNYNDYGGRGITICNRWLKFENFYEDMGDKPEGKSLDRIDNNGNYCKENCRWANSKEQANNKRDNHILIYNNKVQTMKQWSDETGIKYTTIAQRLKYGWSVEKTLSKSPT